jgi:hypothetical protein
MLFGSRLAIRASEPNQPKRANLLFDRLLNDSMTGEQFNNDTVATHLEESSKPPTDNTGTEQDNTKTPDEQEEDGVTVMEFATELPGSTSSCAARMSAEAPTNSQQTDLVSDKPTGAYAEPDLPACLGKPNGEASTVYYNINLQS